MSDISEVPDKYVPMFPEGTAFGAIPDAVPKAESRACTEEGGAESGEGRDDGNRGAAD